MPPSRRNKRRYAKRRKAAIPKQISPGFPRETRVKMRYNDTVSLTSTAGVISKYLFRANSCFDPNQTGVGHQPSGYDQWSLFYNNYVVLSCKMSAKFLWDVSEPVTPLTCGVFLSDDSTNPTLYSNIKELGRGQQRDLAPNAGSTICRTYYSAKRFWNITDVKDNVKRIGADVSANPTDDCVAVVYAQSTDYAATSSPVCVVVTMDFDVLFSEPKDLAQS